ncbi:MAG TPA: TolC family protein [Verrucomicrobiae bacterium]|nr:TolC family protein [Verrucomicrobiae bacterium]
MIRILRGLAAASLVLATVQPAHAASTNAVPNTLRLPDCIDLALRQNPTVLKAREEIRRNQGVVVEVRAQAIPQLTASGSYEAIDSRAIDQFPFSGGGATSNSPNMLFRNQEQPWNIQIQVSQLVYAGGRVSAAVRAAKLSDQIATLGFQSTVADTILDVRRDFYQILLDIALVEVRQQSVTLLEEQLRDAQSRFDVGSVPRFNVLRAEVELENAKPPLIRAQNDLRLAKEALVKLLGIDTPSQTSTFTPINFEGKLLYEHRDWDLAAALEQARQRRPELISADRQISVARANVQVASSGYKPQASVFGNWGWHDYTFSDDPGVTRSGWILGANINWALFDGMLTHGKITEARAQLQEANLDYADTRRQVELEVRQAYSDYLQTLELIEAQKKTVEEAEESLRLAEARFRAGTGTQLDVLSAQTALTEARSNEIQALHDYNVAIATLERATGMTVRMAD